VVEAEACRSEAEIRIGILDGADGGQDARQGLLALEHPGTSSQRFFEERVAEANGRTSRLVIDGDQLGSFEIGEEVDASDVDGGSQRQGLRVGEDLEGSSLGLAELREAGRHEVDQTRRNLRLVTEHPTLGGLLQHAAREVGRDELARVQRDAATGLPRDSRGLGVDGTAERVAQQHVERRWFERPDIMAEQQVFDHETVEVRRKRHVRSRRGDDLNELLSNEAGDEGRGGRIQQRCVVEDDENRIGALTSLAFEDAGEARREPSAPVDGVVQVDHEVAERSEGHRG
jgi:hypothetical protein